MAGFLFCILFGAVSGFAEILPISAFAHQKILYQLAGVQSAIPLYHLLTHIALLAAVYYSCRTSINRIRRESRTSARSRGRTYRSVAHFERKFLRSAVIPMLIGFVLYAVLRSSGSGLWIALFLIVNGAIILVQEHIPHGNRDAGKLSTLDAVLMGGFSVLSALPGLSRNNLVFSYAVIRGVDRKNAVHYMLLLCIPAFLMLCIVDIIQIITIGLGVASFTAFLFALFSAISAFFSAILAIRLVRSLVEHIGFSFFAYYSLGLALLSLVLYLIS